MQQTTLRLIAVRQAPRAITLLWPGRIRLTGLLAVARYVLGGLWLLDGLLQLQPYMFTPGFARQIVAPAAAGQPSWVAAPVTWSAGLMQRQPVLADATFAAVQILLGLAILWRRSARGGLAVSMAWALGVWYFGEALGGMASGGANILTGAPGAVVLYLLAAAVLLCASAGRQRAAGRCSAVSWACVWTTGAVLALAGAQYVPSAQRATAQQSYAVVPGILSGADHAFWHFMAASSGPGLVLAGLELVLATGAFAPAKWRRAAALGGALLGAVVWVFGEGLGGLWSGSATDPNSGPLLVLLALLLAATSPAAQTRPEPEKTPLFVIRAGGQLRNQSAIPPRRQRRQL